MENIKRVDVLGCPFDAISFEDAVAAIRAAILSKRRLQVVPASIDMAIKARKNPTFKNDIWNADLVIADGVPIVWAAYLLGEPLKGRVSGTDMVWKCAQISKELGCPMVLLGGKYRNTKKAAEVMMNFFPGASIHALYTPFPLTPEESRKLVARILELKAGIVLLALGAPKQEAWIRQNLEASGAFVGMGIGSAFDIISGATPRAPRPLRDHGFEWFHRMIQEPRRLAKRYLIQDSPFLFLLCVELVKRRIR